MKTIIYTIKCKFCQKETGKIELSEERYKNISLTNGILGIEDSRCSECETEKGTYKEEVDKKKKDELKTNENNNII